MGINVSQMIGNPTACSNTKARPSGHLLEEPIGDKGIPLVVRGLSAQRDNYYENCFHVMTSSMAFHAPHVFRYIAIFFSLDDTM